MRITRALDRRLDRVRGVLEAQDMDAIFDIGFRIIAGPPPDGTPLRVSRATVDRIAARTPTSPFDAAVIEWAQEQTGRKTYE